MYKLVSWQKIISKCGIWCTTVNQSEYQWVKVYQVWRAKIWSEQVSPTERMDQKRHWKWQNTNTQSTESVQHSIWSNKAQTQSQCLESRQNWHTAIIWELSNGVVYEVFRWHWIIIMCGVLCHSSMKTQYIMARLGLNSTESEGNWAMG